MSKTRNVIPDVHADADRLDRTLRYLGTEQNVAFLGDFIDAGRTTSAPDDRAVLHRVRGLVEDKGAVAVMGNHELNAILFHRLGVDGVPLRQHSDRNRAQHRSFVEAFGIASNEALAWTDWFLTLPLWRDLDGLRLVHACWNQPDIDLIAERRPDGRLQEEDLPEIAAKDTNFGSAVNNLVTGPELRLPEGYSFHDAGGDERFDVRIAWWRPHARTWRQAALSVPDPSELPEFKLPECREISFYPADAPPVLVGHYKMTGPPAIEETRAACLDYPNTTCVYRWRGEAELDMRSLAAVARSEET